MADLDVIGNIWQDHPTTNACHTDTYGHVIAPPSLPARQTCPRHAQPLPASHLRGICATRREKPSRLFVTEFRFFIPASRHSRTASVPRPPSSVCCCNSQQEVLRETLIEPRDTDFSAKNFTDSQFLPLTNYNQNWSHHQKIQPWNDTAMKWWNSPTYRLRVIYYCISGIVRSTG